MAPNTTCTSPPVVLAREGEGEGDVDTKNRDPYFENWWSQIVWKNVIYMAILHGVAAYGLLTIPIKDTIPTHIWSVFAGLVGGFGVTAGAHRLWTHRSFKAKVPLRIILAICYSIAGENTIFDWVRDHRVHHKFSETDADPHNANRGFFFSHMGWLMMRKHPEVIRKGKQIDMSDILADPVVTFHAKYFTELKILFCFILPTIVPHYLWGETWYNSIFLSTWRYVLMLNSNWLVNSAAHIWGYHPYDKRINPAENIAVAFLTMGEGWHNYHHVFPWDYRAAELGSYALNMTTFYLDMFAKIGWAHDLKCPSAELVEKVAKRYGDGSHPKWGDQPQEVPEEEDTKKTVLHPLEDHLDESEEDLDKILSEYETTDTKNEEQTIPEAGHTDLSKSDSLPNDKGRKEVSNSHTSLQDKADKPTESPRNTAIYRGNKYKTGAYKYLSPTNGTLGYKNPMFSPRKTTDSRTLNSLSMKCAVPNEIVKGKEVINSHVEPVVSYFLNKNDVARNETLSKESVKYDARVGTTEKTKTVSNSSVNCDHTSSTKEELNTESKPPSDVICEQRFCTKDMKAGNDNEKNIH